MSKKGYVAGPLFNEAEIGQRLKEGKMLKELIPTVTFYNPIEAPVNDKSTLPTAEDIFQMDTDYILDSDYILADLAHEDPGVTMELGIVYGVEFARKELLKVLEEEGIAKEKIERIEKALEEKGIKMEQAEIVQLAETKISLTEDQYAKIENLVEKLEELDDVQNVYHNAEEE